MRQRVTNVAKGLKTITSTVTHDARDATQSVKTTVKDELGAALAHRWEPTVARAAVLCGLAGIFGSLTMLLGDVLLYGPAAFGQPADTYFQQVDPVSSKPEQLLSSIMGAASTPRIVVGGLLGPLAGALYVVGCLQMVLAALPVVSVDGKFRWSPSSWKVRAMWGMLACGGHWVLFLLVGTYHAVFAYTGLLSSSGLASLRGADNCQGTGCPEVLHIVEGHKTYMETLRSLIGIFGILGSVGLVAICASDENPLFPRRLLLVTPVFWLIFLRSTGLLSYLPAPLGLIVAGGSFNLMFLIFFSSSTASAFVFERKFRAGD